MMIKINRNNFIKDNVNFEITSKQMLYAQWIPNAPSDWVLSSNVPSRAQIVDEKWVYTKTETSIRAELIQKINLYTIVFLHSIVRIIMEQSIIQDKMDGNGIGFETLILLMLNQEVHIIGTVLIIIPVLILIMKRFISTKRLHRILKQTLKLLPVVRFPMFNIM